MSDQQPSSEQVDSDSVRVARWLRLLTVLREGQINRHELLERLGTVYAPGDSGRRNLARDVDDLGALGIKIKVSNNRPPVYSLVGALPLYDEEELRTLALIRDRFDGRTQVGRRVHRLLARLTAELTPEERAIYEQRGEAKTPHE
ncbi:MAG TPA: hypothetical protein VFS21_16025 [Roseiflexaceae bacterium]|nr:hypothetical protein [Roseiflexaceae bacterium]